MSEKLKGSGLALDLVKKVSGMDASIIARDEVLVGLANRAYDLLASNGWTGLHRGIAFDWRKGEIVEGKSGLEIMVNRLENRENTLRHIDDFTIDCEVGRISGMVERVEIPRGGGVKVRFTGESGDIVTNLGHINFDLDETGIVVHELQRDGETINDGKVKANDRFREKIRRLVNEGRNRVVGQGMVSPGIEEMMMARIVQSLLIDGKLSNEDSVNLVQPNFLPWGLQNMLVRSTLREKILLGRIEDFRRLRDSDARWEDKMIKQLPEELRQPAIDLITFFWESLPTGEITLEEALGMQLRKFIYGFLDKTRPARQMFLPYTHGFADVTHQDVGWARVFEVKNILELPFMEKMGW